MCNPNSHRSKTNKSRIHTHQQFDAPLERETTLDHHRHTVASGVHINQTEQRQSHLLDVLNFDFKVNRIQSQTYQNVIKILIQRNGAAVGSGVRNETSFCVKRFRHNLRADEMDSLKRN